jgi:hypothetical protein
VVRQAPVLEAEQDLCLAQAEALVMALELQAAVATAKEVEEVEVDRALAMEEQASKAWSKSFTL